MGLADVVGQGELIQTEPLEGGVRHSLRLLFEPLLIEVRQHRFLGPIPEVLPTPCIRPAVHVVERHLVDTRLPLARTLILSRYSVSQVVHHHDVLLHVLGRRRRDSAWGWIGGHEAVAAGDVVVATVPLLVHDQPHCHRDGSTAIGGAAATEPAKAATGSGCIHHLRLCRICVDGPFLDVDGEFLLDAQRHHLFLGVGHPKIAVQCQIAATLTATLDFLCTQSLDLFECEGYLLLPNRSGEGLHADEGRLGAQMSVQPDPVALPAHLTCHLLVKCRLALIVENAQIPLGPHQDDFAKAVLCGCEDDLQHISLEATLTP
mmetsp:Transcript_4504/g.10437  ORF Transcript_4504/g.10437 Transcript_4504/m.10437 type:complete len:318 (+) Transcript_4504:1088-2041(+)